MRQKIAHGVKTELSQKRIDMERRILKCKIIKIVTNDLEFFILGIIITITGFLFSWTPYAIVFFILAFSQSGTYVPPMATFICSCFAKTSVMWIPLLYISTSAQLRFSLVDSGTLEKIAGATTVVRAD